MFSPSETALVDQQAPVPYASRRTSPLAQVDFDGWQHEFHDQRRPRISFSETLLTTMGSI